MWYIGISAKWWDTVADFAEVRSRLFDARSKSEIFRVLAPRKALPAEIDELHDIGFRRS